MASIGNSAIGFLRGAWGAIFSAFAAITDPLSVAKMTGIIDPNTQWALGETAMRYLFVTAAIVWAFVWYHGVNKRMERGTRDPHMPLHQVLRWIARDSDWASKYSWPDDQWVTRVESEFLTKWQLGRFEMMGQDRKGNSGITFLPPAMKGSAEFHAHMLVSTEPPTHIWSKEARYADGAPRCFYEVKLDRREVVEVWPRRSFLNRLLRNSPIERMGEAGYREIFRKQDEWYADNYSLPGTPLGWILAGE